jgi:DNA-directed RNA polymerase specialized sigma24 family protein
MNERYMTPESMTDILRTLKRHNVPLQHSVTLLCKLQGRAISDLATACGYHRNSVYKALAGEVVQVQEDMMDAVTKELGINPWAFAPKLPKKKRTSR